MNRGERGRKRKMKSHAARALTNALFALYSFYESGCPASSPEVEASIVRGPLNAIQVRCAENLFFDVCEFVEDCGGPLGKQSGGIRRFHEALKAVAEAESGETNLGKLFTTAQMRA
jgi:hypothetical protein